MHSSHTPLVLIVLDGWGHSEIPEHNAIHMARLPFWQKLLKEAPHTFAIASGLAVGLPEGQMGNSEVGHLHIGAGRQVLQDLTRVDEAIASGSFSTNTVFSRMIDTLLAQDKALHVLALLSDGGVHSHIAHIQAMIRLAAERGLKKIYLHAFLDGRDTPPQSAKTYLLAMEELFETLGCGQIVSMIGRYYAMDRDNRWDRTERAYDLLTQGKAECHAATALEGLEKAYARGETDEFVSATYIGDAKHPLQEGDAVVCMNFRSDRVRQLSRALTQPSFSAFQRAVTPLLSHYVTLTHYADDIPSEVAFSPLFLTHTLGACIAETGQKQLRIAETEKYAHVTFFFNGGEENPYAGEERILVPSPKVATYDVQPEMSALPLTDRLIEAIHSQQYALIVCNFANPDMLGHTGNVAATISALETIDGCLARIITALKEVGGEALITADHGNAECMFNANTEQPHTAHTTNLVPVVYVGRPATPTTAEGVLYDIAPTMLDLMGIPKPAEMTGKALFQLKKS